MPAMISSFSLRYSDSGRWSVASAGDINKDGLPDIVVGNKKGTFVHLHEKKSVAVGEFEKGQPKIAQ